jgi:cytochrome c-type biogenesis protein CcmF
MMAEIGQAAIWLSVFSSLWAIAMLFMGLRYQNDNAIRSGRNSVIGTFALISVATGALIYSFITNDFSMRYVAEVSSYDQPLLYKITALWGRMSGSLLFWLWLVTLFGALVVWMNRRAADHLADYALIPISIVQLFFVILVTGLIEGVYNPLTRFPNGMVAPDGAGMNPLLQTPSMAFHPPSLYIGFVSLTVPFAFGIGALAAGKTGSEWLLRSRRWMVFSWLALTLGVTLGGNWAYRELGWGGYWAWDPVENASFMPWLLGTAYLHSVMIQEKRNMLKLWNILLITLAFEFTLLGTFITRSGIISSVHSFAQSDIGHYFLSFIFLSLVGIAWLVYYRWNDLKSPNRLESLLSRESSFLLNNWMLVGLTLIILWGTLWPIITEGVTGTKSAVPEAFFNQVVVIPGLFLLLLTGVGPIISWKKLTPSNFKRMFAKPMVLGVIGGGLTWGYLALRGHATPIYSVLCVFAGVFVLVAIFDEFYRGSKLRAKRQETSFLNGLTRLIGRNKRRYGGYIVHIGIVVVYIGIMGSKGYFRLESKSLGLDESMEVGAYKLTLKDSFREQRPNYSLGGVIFAVEKGGKPIGTMRPARGFYHKAGQGEQDTIESAIRHFGLNDLYIALGPLPEDVPGYVRSGALVSVQVYHNPLVNLVWVGVAIMMVGGGIALLEKSQMKRET